MSDARSLLRAKRQEVRVNHPLASYTATGQLRCIACGINIKQGTSWEGHIGSKQHRTSAARLREEEQRRAQEELLRQKRKASEEWSDGEDEGIEAKRRRVDGPADNEDEDEHPAPVARGVFPADFFSDPSHAPPPASEDEEDEDALDDARGAPPAPAAKSAIDEEWERFQATVVNPPDAHEMYERATVFAEPVLASEVPEGFPPQATDALEEGKDAVVDDAEIRRRKEQDERELIMDRLLDEERAQEEADAKVTLLKSRLETVRRQREARKAAAKTKRGQT
ncbi:hypothetical protein DAEQUDRAFT_733805 [Daedalea quercina L-15889]|uniref:Uncharacterized protein n=1 Tax=Daedalea quercina L-15889 TaxID=1314783 RepID=A0A165KQI8_9APHY|nr:hypothetical protein DAEQUDRAFT_733805 [Daedalea quercina L-15889]